jgi:exopolysaccharide biosynthesis polyprenyl glycosylphosphotransferase
MFTRLRPLIFYLAMADVMLTQLALLVADRVRRYIPLGEPLDPNLTNLNPAIQLIVLLVFPATFLALHVYSVRRDTNPVGDATGLVRAVGAAMFVFAGVLYFSYRDLPRLLVIYFFVFELAGLAALRLSLLLGLRLLRWRGRPLSRVLMAGAGEMAERVVEVVRARLPDTVEVIGCVDDAAAAGPCGLRVLGRLADAPRLVTEGEVDEIIIALPSEQYAAVEALAYSLLTLPVRIRLVPDYLRLVVVQSSVEALGGIPLIGLREPRLTGLTWAVKRVFDVVATTLLLLVTWPLMVFIALAIRWDSPGPAIFKQQRVGENGRMFWVYKFRTMITDADMQQPDIVLDRHGQKVFKAPDDKRVTRMGRFLRRTSLDELPQFFNVIKGEMSLVGPRPEQQFIVEQYEPWQRQRLAVPPGLTGWWQVNGRSDLPLHLNTQFDLYYIRNYSLWLDLVILWKTIGVVLRGVGAY